MVEVAQPLFAQLPLGMPLFVFGHWSPHAVPAAAAVVLRPVAVALSTVHMAIVACVRVGPADPPRSSIPEPTDVDVPVEVGAVAPVVVHVHVTDAVVPT